MSWVNSKKLTENITTEVVARSYSVRKLLEISQNSQENTCAGVSLLIKLHALDCNFIKTETLTQVCSCEFCEISITSFLTEHLRWLLLLLKVSPSNKRKSFGYLEFLLDRVYSITAVDQGNV